MLGEAIVLEILGLGQAPARQAALKAGLDKSTEAVTLNKMCGSGLQAVAMARQALLANEANVVIAGGMESMSRAPFLMTTTGLAGSVSPEARA